VPCAYGLDPAAARTILPPASILDDRDGGILMADRLFIFGVGYTARHLSDAVRGGGWTIGGTARSDDACAALGATVATPGIDGYRFDGTAPMADPARALAGATHLLVSVPPDRDGDPVLRHHGGDIARCGSLRWIGYLSTTGVYGDRAGGWVDEASALAPSGRRGARRVAAERAWFALGARTGVPVHSFRLAGIYGPGRNQLEAVRAGTARRLDKPGQVFSRIHVEDIVQVLRASMARPRAGAAYNVCDDRPAAPAEVVAFAARLLGVAPPPVEPFDAADLSPMARSFYDDNKRVRNGLIRQELGVVLRYPDYEAGLRALLPSLER
jgi:hypothetical protein